MHAVWFVAADDGESTTRQECAEQVREPGFRIGEDLMRTPPHDRVEPEWCEPLCLRGGVHEADVREAGVGGAPPRLLQRVQRFVYPQREA